MATQLSEIYTQYPFARSALSDICSRRKVSTEQFLAKTSIPREEELKPDYNNHDAALALMFLPAAAIKEHFSERTLLWTWAHMYIDDEEALVRGIQETTGRDATLLRKAREAQWNLESNGRDLDNILRTYDMLNAVKEQRMTVPVQECLLGKEAVAAKEGQKYTITFHYPRKHYYRSYIQEFWESQYEIYLDAPIGMLLRYKGVPQAIAGMMPHNQALMIYQLQGIRSRADKAGDTVEGKRRTSARGIGRLRWVDTLVNCTAAVAHQWGFAEVAVREGCKNRWCHEPHHGEKEPPLTFEEAFKRYDATAIRLQFTQHADKNWYKSTEELRALFSAPELIS
jgi:hypothetical protein